MSVDMVLESMGIHLHACEFCTEPVMNYGPPCADCLHPTGLHSSWGCARCGCEIEYPDAPETTER